MPEGLPVEDQGLMRVPMTPSRWKSLITSETASRDG